MHRQYVCHIGFVNDCSFVGTSASGEMGTNEQTSISQDRPKGVWSGGDEGVLCI